MEEKCKKQRKKMKKDKKDKKIFCILAAASSYFVSPHQRKKDGENENGRKSTRKTEKDKAAHGVPPFEILLTELFTPGNFSHLSK